jgi:hypothetical protein
MQSIVARHWRRMELFGFDRAYWHAKIAAFFHEFQMEYAARRGKQRWADKTPRYTPHIGFLNQVFEDCQFVHLIRDPRDVVASHRERWGYRAALGCAATTWRQYVAVAREVGRNLSPGRYIELRFEDLVRTPEPVLRSLLDFLGEPWSDNVVRYKEFDHDFADESGKLREARRRIDDAGIDPSRAGGRKRLDPLLATVLRLNARDLMTELRYG